MSLRLINEITYGHSYSIDNDFKSNLPAKKKKFFLYESRTRKLSSFKGSLLSGGGTNTRGLEPVILVLPTRLIPAFRPRVIPTNLDWMYRVVIVRHNLRRERTCVHHVRFTLVTVYDKGGGIQRDTFFTLRRGQYVLYTCRTRAVISRELPELYAKVGFIFSYRVGGGEKECERINCHAVVEEQKKSYKIRYNWVVRVYNRSPEFRVNRRKQGSLNIYNIYDTIVYILFCIVYPLVYVGKCILYTISYCSGYVALYSII